MNRQDLLRRLEWNDPSNEYQGYIFIKTYDETVNYLLETYAEDNTHTHREDEWYNTQTNTKLLRNETRYDIRQNVTLRTLYRRTDRWIQISSRSHGQMTPIEKRGQSRTQQRNQIHANKRIRRHASEFNR